MDSLIFSRLHCSVFLLGNEKHSIQVASQQEDGEPTLQDMAVLIEQVTGVPVPFQKLIYKGNL